MTARLPLQKRNLSHISRLFDALFLRRGRLSKCKVVRSRDVRDVQPIRVSVELAEQGEACRCLVLRPHQFSHWSFQLAHNTTSPLATMRPLTSSAGPALRGWTRHQLPVTRIASAAAVQQRKVATTQGEVSHTSSFDSPFGRTHELEPPTTKIPSFKNYMSNRPEVTNRVFQYFVVGTMGMLAAAGAKATVQGALQCNWIAILDSRKTCSMISLLIRSSTTDFLVNMSASADVLAQAKVEVDLSAIPEGKNVRQYLPSSLLRQRTSLT